MNDRGPSSPNANSNSEFAQAPIIMFVPMLPRTDDLRIREIKELVTPASVMREFPLTENAAQLTYETRQAIHRILAGEDDRLLVIIGPCSIHDPIAAMDYAKRLKLEKDRL